jgi:hypothetical protein
MKRFSKNFKKLFLLYFTRELILHSAKGEFLQLKNLVKEQIKDEKDELIHSIKRKTLEKKEILDGDLTFHKIFRGMKPRFYSPRKILTIPKSHLPAHLQYLKPIPRKIEIDLEKLNSLIKDPAVKVIECNGPDEHIIVRGSMGVKPTNIVLGKEEINKIIKKFSEISNIPIHEGVYHVVAGRLILSAIVSEVISSKFMIKKMLYAPYFRGQTYPQPMIR